MMEMNGEKILAWHFVKDDGYLSHDMKGVKVYPGLELQVDENRLQLCNYGLHASVEALDALQYAPGAFACQVELSGRILHDSDKCVASQRTVLAMADATRTLHEFALWCAERALALVDNPDPRSLEALRIKRLWLDGQVTDMELAAARAAAGAAVRDAPRAVTWAASRHAAWYAAWYAARDAARDAAWAAAGAAARDAARDAQNQKLESMLNDLINMEVE